MNNTVPQARAAIAAALVESKKQQRRPALSMFATVADYQAARTDTKPHRHRLAAAAQAAMARCAGAAQRIRSRKGK